MTYEHPAIIKRERDKKGVPGKTHPLHRCWRNMRYRCNTSTSKDYSNYGGRGIKVDSQWDDFEKFYLWALPGWTSGLQLDRINNDESYGPNNCRWVTAKTNNNNKRTNRSWEYNGTTYTSSQLYDLLKPRMDRKTFHARLAYGWTVDKAVSMEVRDDGKI